MIVAEASQKSASGEVEQSLNLEGLANQTYLLKVKTREGEIIRRIVKQ